MEDRVIITSTSNKFFASLVNLLASLRDKYPDHPIVYVYDLGLWWSYRQELENLPKVKVLTMPKFISFWRKCYTWKTYILSHPLGRLNFYMDAGCQVLKPLDPIFSKLDQDGYFAVDQQVKLARIVPQEFHSLFYLQPHQYEQFCITAGVFGFKVNSVVTPILKKLYEHALCGLCLGFAPGEQWKNRGVNKTEFVRDCEMFRHDTTLISLLMRQELGDYKSHTCLKYAAPYSKNDHPEEMIWNLRMNYLTLEYLNRRIPNSSFIFYFNRTVLNGFILLRLARLFIKGKLWNIRNLSKSAQ